MELVDALKRRRMVRSFEDRPVPRPVLEALLGLATRAPSAGFTQGWDFIVLDRPDQTRRFWELTSDPEWRRSGRQSQALMRAPAIVIPTASPRPYLARYSEPDKQASGLSREEDWPVPYWLVDTAFATMLLLVAAVDAGLGALFFRIRAGERQLLDSLGVPPDRRPIGAVALGYPDRADRPSSSVARERRPLDEVVHWGRW
jgi:nitroreductase